MSSLLSQNGARTDASHAALFNELAWHVHEYDDTHLPTIIHPTGPGDDFILALVAGIETECRLGMGVWACGPKHYDVGWHITSTVGSIGAAVTVGKLMCLESTPMQYIAATQALEAKRGWARVMSIENTIDTQFTTLGAEWEIARNAFKCGIVVHPVIDRCRCTVNRGYTAADIKSVDVRVHPLVLETHHEHRFPGPYRL
ncbi:hypothetical protein K438DRAFT_1964028 [Mycena galopus ATCC 62051]|nr:hypothetical protein K438DRAFT_1964028 [Mycena galopus ATCC 62051]